MSNSKPLKRVVLFGSSGFIGRNILEILGNKYDFIEVNRDTHDIEKESYLFNEVDAVINCVNCNDNLLAFLNMTRYFAGKFIQIGSGAEYDHSLPIKNVTEDFNRKPKDAYGLGKYYITEHAKFMPGVVVLRPFGVFGKYEDTSRRFISNAIIDNLQGKPITIYQNCKFSYVWVNDLVKIIDYFINHERQHKVYNIGGHKITLKDIAKQIGKYKVLKGKMAPEYTCDDNRIRQETGIRYTSFKESLKRLKEFYDLS